MPNLTQDMLRSLPQVSAFPGWETLPSTGNQTLDAPMSGTASPERAPTRVLTLPDPTVGGYAEIPRPIGRTVDQAFSSRFQNVQFQGQGHYDQVPTWNDEEAQGVGTPNRHGIKLRQGVLSQLGGYQPPAAASALPYVAALSAIPTYSTIDQVANR